jgi:hypothetical protein
MGEFRQKWKALNPLLRAGVYVIAGIITLLIILEIIISVWGGALLARHLKKKITQATGNAYSIHFQNLDLDLYKSTVTIYRLHIHADTAAFHQSFSPSQQPPSSLYQGTVQKLKISGFHLFSALRGRALYIHEILIKKPDITILKNPRPVPKDTSRHFSSVDSSIYADISNSYQALKVDKFAIRHAQVVSMRSGDTLTVLGEVNLVLKNIKVDSASARSGRRFVTDNIALNAHHLMVNMSDSLNKLTLGRLFISSDKHSILLDSLHLKPRYPKFIFSKKNGVQIDRINLLIPKLACRHVNFTAFADSGNFHSGYVEIDHVRLQDFHSMIPPPPTPSPKSLYNTSLINLNQKVKFDSIKIKDSYVSYAEYHPPAPKAGKVTFKNLNATFREVTNYPKAIEKGDTIKVYAKANVMGKGLLHVHWAFPLDTHNAFHKIHGSLSSMSLTAFNPILEYVASVKVNRGKLNHLTFKFTANDDKSSGSLIMNYQNLKVSLLKKKTAKQQGIKKNVLSFAANKFIIRKNNTPKSGMQAGKIAMKRNKDKSTWNFWWKSLLSGIKTSIK